MKAAAVRLFSVAVLGGAALGWLGAHLTGPDASPSAKDAQGPDASSAVSFSADRLGRVVLVRGTRAGSVESRIAARPPTGVSRRSQVSLAPLSFAEPASQVPWPAQSTPLPRSAIAATSPDADEPPAEPVDAGALVVEVGPGIALPAAFLPGDEALSPELAKLKAGIAQEFEREIADALSEQTDAPQHIEDIYSAAKSRADERFRQLFGDEAFNHYAARAAREAAAEEDQ